VDIERNSIGEERLRRNGELTLVSGLAFLLSVGIFAWFYRLGDILLYGDAVAHLNIARRLTDARNPGWEQLGTVWLPLPHLLVAPFVANDWLWRTGVGGSIPSMLAYVLGVVGIYRLVRARASVGRRRAGRRHLCLQSVAALHAIDGHDRIDFPRGRHLVGGLL
jgi:hypothetical protein